MRTSAAAAADAALNRASILFAPGGQTSAHKHKSKYTLDRGIPGAFEGETVTRRRFMTGTAHTAGAVAAASFALPALGFAIGPIFKQHAAPLGNGGHGRRLHRKQLHPGRAHAHARASARPARRPSYVRKHNPAIDTDPYDRDTPYIAISDRCAHLGCPVRWVDAAERFICPCHGGVYDLLGRRVGGPPVRPLDRFYTRVNGDNVELGPRFSVNSQLRRFSPRDPGEPLDGIGQYLYPSRPDARKL